MYLVALEDSLYIFNQFISFCVCNCMMVLQKKNFFFLPTMYYYLATLQCKNSKFFLPTYFLVFLWLLKTFLCLSCMKWTLENVVCIANRNDFRPFLSRPTLHYIRQVQLESSYMVHIPRQYKYEHEENMSYVLKCITLWSVKHNRFQKQQDSYLVCLSGK